MDDARLLEFPGAVLLGGVLIDLTGVHLELVWYLAAEHKLAVAPPPLCLDQDLQRVSVDDVEASERLLDVLVVLGCPQAVLLYVVTIDVDFLGRRHLQLGEVIGARRHDARQGVVCELELLGHFLEHAVGIRPQYALLLLFLLLVEHSHGELAVFLVYLIFLHDDGGHPGLHGLLEVVIGLQGAAAQLRLRRHHQDGSGLSRFGDVALWRALVRPARPSLEKLGDVLGGDLGDALIGAVMVDDRPLDHGHLALLDSLHRLLAVGVALEFAAWLELVGIDEKSGLQ